MSKISFTVLPVAINSVVFYLLTPKSENATAWINYLLASDWFILHTIIDKRTTYARGHARFKTWFKPTAGSKRR
jgi:hypothetical protein